jgi:hypothetical protein
MNRVNTTPVKNSPHIKGQISPAILYSGQGSIFFSGIRLKGLCHEWNFLKGLINRYFLSMC